MQSVEAMSERILYWLSLNMEVRALAERLLEGFAVTVGDLPASAAHHHAEPGGLYRHSLEVALKALEAFEGAIKMERRPDGSVDSFRSSHNRPRWQYATFIAALCHDLGKLFELEVRGRATNVSRHALPMDDREVKHVQGRQIKTTQVGYDAVDSKHQHAWRGFGLHCSRPASKSEIGGGRGGLEHAEKQHKTHPSPIQHGPS